VQERRAYGVRKYGRPLETHNGRDALTDAWEEALDLVTYLTQMRLERGDELPGAADAPLSPYYEHPSCGFHWHGRDGMDIPIRDGEPVCPRCEIERLREKHKASLRRADKVNNELMAEVQRYAIGAERPVLWSVYNRMHSRAAHAEAALNRVGRIARRLAAHAVGFKNVLDASDHGPWGTTVGADIAELIEALSDQPATGPAGGAQQPADGDRIVAYRSALPGALSVYCTNHTDDLGGGVMPLTSDDLPNGGVCAGCGVDVLIPQEPRP
jgi:hypothetical protein